MNTKLKTFLYLLMRDELPLGVVEKLARDAQNDPPGVTYSNTYLAEYVDNLAVRLTA